MTTGPPPNIIVPFSNISVSGQIAECSKFEYRQGRDWQTNRNLSADSSVNHAKA